MKTMLILSGSDPTRFAGYAPIGIRDELERHGVKTAFITKYKPKYDRYPNVLYYYSGVWALLKRIIHRFRVVIVKIVVRNPHKKQLLTDIFPFLPTMLPGRLRKMAKIKPDAILVFFMPGFVNYADLYVLYKYFKCKIIVSTPDMQPFTGLCHFSEGCSNFEYQCGRCHLIKSKSRYDVTWLLLMFKIMISRNINLHGLCWTSEYEGYLAKSPIFDETKIIRVPNLKSDRVNMRQPSKKEKNDIRNEFGISENDFVLLICAANLGEKRKGVSDIVQAIDLVVTNGSIYNCLVIVTAGEGELPQIPNVKRIVNLGFLFQEDLYKAYWLSDVHISASKADVGPGTMVMALRCGVPVISYKTGTAPERIEDGIDGYLVDVNDIHGLAKRVQDFYELNESIKEQWSRSAAYKSKARRQDNWISNLVKAI